MREQVITHRSNARAAVGSRSRTPSVSTQRPIRRERGGASQSEQGVGVVRRVLGWIPRAVKVMFVIAAAVLVFAGYRAAASASFFQVRTIDVSGVSKTSVDQVKAIVRKLGAPGVWRADLNEMSKEIGELPWVRTAVVSRVLPDGLRVRITERTQQAVVRLSTGRIVWVDDESAVLGDVQPSDQMPEFFVRGWNESVSEDARDENRTRVAQFKTLSTEFASAGLSRRLSEIDLTDLADVRVQLGGDDADISVRIGSRDLTNHLIGALKKLDEAKSTEAGPRIIYVDNALGTRVVLGTDRPIVKQSTSADGVAPATPKQRANSGTKPLVPGLFALTSTNKSSGASRSDAVKRNDHLKPNGKPNAESGNEKYRVH